MSSWLTNTNVNNAGFKGFCKYVKELLAPGKTKLGE